MPLVTGKPEEASKGAGFQVEEGVVRIIESYYEVEDYSPSAQTGEKPVDERTGRPLPPFVCHIAVMQRLDGDGNDMGDPIPNRYRVGDINQFQVSDEPREDYALNGGGMTEGDTGQYCVGRKMPDENSQMSRFHAAAVKRGYRQDKMVADIGHWVGTVGQIHMEEFEGVRGGKPVKLPIFKEIISFPWDAKGGKKVAGKKAAPKASKKQEEAAEEAADAGEEIEEVAHSVIEAAVKTIQGQTVERNKFNRLILTTANKKKIKRPEQKAIVDLISHDQDFMENVGLLYGFSLSEDGKEVVIEE